MKEVGRGWQYIVYDLGNGRVRKVRWYGPRRVILVWCQLAKGKRNFVRALREIGRVDRMVDESCEYVRKILPSFDANLLGNPKFISATEYEQDRVEPFGKIFETISFEDGKCLIDRQAVLIQDFWKYGFSEAVYNFTLNSGVNNAEHVILFDFGELVFDKQEARQDIETKRWLRASSYLHLPDGELKNYYAETMERTLTVAKLEESWGKSLMPKN